MSGVARCTQHFLKWQNCPCLLSPFKSCVFIKKIRAAIVVHSSSHFSLRCHIFFGSLATVRFDEGEDSGVQYCGGRRQRHTRYALLIRKAPPPHRQTPVEKNARGRSRAEQHNSTTTTPPTMVKKQLTSPAPTVHSRSRNRAEEEVWSR